MIRRQWHIIRTGVYLAVAVICSLALTVINVIPPTIPTSWMLPNAWGIYIPQRVDYPWPSYEIQVILWIVMVGMLVAISRQLPVASRQLPAKAKKYGEEKNRQALWILVGITLVGFGLRLHGIRELPLIIDEVGFASHASDILHGQHVPIFAPGHNANSSTYSWIMAGVMALFGQNTFTIRLLPLVFGTLSIPAVYRLGGQWWSRRIGLLAAAFLATYPAHIFYSQMSIYNIVDPFFVMLALACLGRALQNPLRRHDWIWAGILAGIAQYFYHGSRLALVLMAVYVVLSLSRKREKRISEEQRYRGTEKNGLLKSPLTNLMPIRSLPVGWWFNILWLILAFGIVAMPRFASMVIDRLPVTGNEEAIRLPNNLDMNALRSALAWFGGLDFSRFWMSGAPLIPWLALIAFVAGLAVSIRHLRDGRYAVLVLSVVLTTIFGGAIWTAAPLFVRYMTAVPAIALLVAVGVEKIQSVSQRFRDTQKQRKRIAVVMTQIVTVVLIGGQGIWAAGAHLVEAKERLPAELWEEDKLAKQAADLPSGMAAVLIATAGFGAKPPDPKMMEVITLAHYVAAYGERRALVLNWDGGKILDAQLRKLNQPYRILIANGEKIF